MFKRIKARLANVGTIKILCEKAEAHARLDQQREPGAEHFLLAAFDLSDGSTQRAFSEFGVDETGLRQAIERQYEEALRSVGLDLLIPGAATGPAPSQRRVFNAAPSGREVMQLLAEGRKDHSPLLGAHVVAIIAGMQDGVAARALRTMGIDGAALKLAAEKIARGGVA